MQQEPSMESGGPRREHLIFEDALQGFFETNLQPGVSYRPGNGRYDRESDKGILVYQDGTCCSGGCCFQDVRQHRNKTYTVVTQYSGCGEQDVDFVKCANLTEVLTELLRYNGDPNVCGDMMLKLVKSLDVAKLEQDPSLWIALKSYVDPNVEA